MTVVLVLSPNVGLLQNAIAKQTKSRQIQVPSTMNERIYGVLRKDEHGVFCYCCSECDQIFKVGFELEHHISFVHERNHRENKVQCSPDSSDIIQLQLPTAIEEDVKAESFGPTEELPPSVTNALELDHFDESVDKFDIIERESDDEDNDWNASDDNKSSQGENVEQEMPTISFVCSVCGQIHHSRESWEEHLKLHDETNETECSMSEERVADADSRSHRTTKKKRRHTCTVCKATYSHSSYLNIHIRRHTGEMPYLCNICGRSFISQGKLTFHMKRHSAVKDHQCDQCERAYCDRFQLRRHIEIVHKGLRLFSCTMCDTKNKFTSRKSLKQHMLLHGEKRFECQFCHQKFAQSAGRRGHEKRVHGAV